MRISEKYNKEVAKELMKELGIKNINAVPKITKVSINVGIGTYLAGSKDYSQVMENVSLIAGQRPIVKKSKKAISNFKLRAGMPVGISVTLRGGRMDDFLTKFVNAVLPRVRDFRGISGKGFDRQGNYSVGVKEYTVFPEVNPDDVVKLHGLQINVATTASTPYEGYMLLKKLDFPFKDEVKKPELIKKKK